MCLFHPFAWQGRRPEVQLRQAGVPDVTHFLGRDECRRPGYRCIQSRSYWLVVIGVATRNRNWCAHAPARSEVPRLTRHSLENPEVSHVRGFPCYGVPRLTRHTREASAP
jgi:hypothetical protein